MSKELHLEREFAKSKMDSLMVAYGMIINIFTTTGVRQSVPYSGSQLAMVIVIIAFCLGYTWISLTGSYTSILSINSYTKGNYEYSIEALHIYLHDHDLSPFIDRKVWKYCLQLWQRHRGEWMPTLITDAPGYLKEDLMHSIYGHHIENHILFARTHVDFIRQLVVHLKRCVFFPGNFMAEKGDIDGCMYFIHKGDVDVYDIQGKNEIPREMLTKNTSFGEVQGLFRVPHDYSYKAHTIVDAVFLDFSDWEYLITWFPASREEIFRNSKQFEVKRTVVQ